MGRAGKAPSQDRCIFNKVERNEKNVQSEVIHEKRMRTDELSYQKQDKMPSASGCPTLRQQANRLNQPERSSRWSLGRRMLPRR